MTAPERTRRRCCLILAVGLVILLVVGLLGPRPEVDTALHPATLPEDLDRHLTEQEAQVADVRSGTAKTIVWADPQRRARTRFALVYLHGFSATRQEVHPLCEQVARRLQANVFYTRLTGHGRTGDALAEATVNAWLNDAHQALRIGLRLGERVVLVGTSTGGTLACWLAAQPDLADEVAALVLISPNFRVRASSARLLHLPWGGQLAELVAGEERSWTPHNEDQERYWTTRYPTRALVTLAGLLDLIDATDLGRVQAPALVLYSSEDRVVDSQMTVTRFEQIGSERKELVELDDTQDPSHHVLAGDVLAPDDTARVADAMVTFLTE